MTRRLVNVMDQPETTVTLAITLPVIAPPQEYVAALMEARDAQARLNNLPAAHALHCVYTLAKCGLHAAMAMPAPLVTKHRPDPKLDHTLAAVSDAMGETPS